MSIISIAIQKGGCGKTTTAINLAAALHREGKKVLLMDADPQASLSEALRLRSNVNLYTELLKEIKGEDSNLEKTILKSGSGLPVIPSSTELAAAELELVTAYGREQMFTWMLQELKRKYDYIFIDCPPSVGMLSVNALVASDYILMTLHPEFLPLKSINGFLQQFRNLRKLNKRLDILGVVLTRYDERRIMNRQVFSYLAEEFGEKIFHSRIRNNISLAKAQEAGTDIFSYDRNSHGAEDYEQLAAEFLLKMENVHEQVEESELIAV